MGHISLIIAPDLGGAKEHQSPCTLLPTLRAYLDKFVSATGDKLLAPNVHSIDGSNPTAVKLSYLRTIIRFPVANLVCGGRDISVGRERELRNDDVKGTTASGGCSIHAWEYSARITMV